MQGQIEVFVLRGLRTCKMISAALECAAKNGLDQLFAIAEIVSQRRHADSCRDGEITIAGRLAILERQAGLELCEQTVAPRDVVGIARSRGPAHLASQPS